jgi:hypothetical protein
MDVASILRQQQASGFSDIAGTQLAATIPIKEGLINQVIAATLPPGGALRHAEIHAHPGEKLTLRVTLGKSFVPPLNIKLEIERQAQLPGSPVIVLKIAGAGGLMAMAGSIAGLASGLPPGMRLDGDRIHVDLRAMLRPSGADTLLDLLEELYVATGDGTVTLAFRARVA